MTLFDMKALKYVQMPAKAFVPLTKAFKTQCCDCGLVHEWIFHRQGRTLGFTVTRDNRATAQRRRNLSNDKIRRVADNPAPPNL